MMRPTHQRLAKLEARRRPVLDRRSKDERDAAVAMALADPKWFHQIGVDLLGGDYPGARQHHAAILAAWRADT
jgi:hypothetical protein